MKVELNSSIMVGEKPDLFYSPNFLVVITITPLPARAPQIEEAAASFNTVILSMSFGLILDTSPS